MVVRKTHFGEFVWSTAESSFNHAVVSCGRKMFNVNTYEIAAECLKMFGVCDVAESVAMRKDRFLKRYVLSSSIVCEVCSICG